jgi:hypothetical protein
MKINTTIIVALALVLAVGSVSSFVTLTGIAHAYESADNNHKGALTLVTAGDWSGARPICEVKSC